MIVGLERYMLTRFETVVPLSGHPFFFGKFCALAGRAIEFIKTPGETDSVLDQRVLRRIYAIAAELDIVFSIIDKIARITEFWYDDGLNTADWQSWVQSDVHAFHVELRSLCDSIAILIRLTCGGQSPESFTQLKSWCRKQDRAVGLLGLRLTNQIRSTEWYDILVDTRDRIIHYRVDAAVKYDNAIMFRLFRDVDPTEFQFKYRPFMSGDWVRFGLYSGYLMGSLIAFLNEVSDEVISYLSTNANVYGYVPARSGIAIAFMEATRDCLRKQLQHR